MKFDYLSKDEQSLYRLTVSFNHDDFYRNEESLTKDYKNHLIYGINATKSTKSLYNVYTLNKYSTKLLTFLRRHAKEYNTDFYGESWFTIHVHNISKITKCMMITMAGSKRLYYENFKFRLDEEDCSDDEKGIYLNDLFYYLMIEMRALTNTK